MFYKHVYKLLCKIYGDEPNLRGYNFFSGDTINSASIYQYKCPSERGVTQPYKGILSTGSLSHYLLE